MSQICKKRCLRSSAKILLLMVTTKEAKRSPCRAKGENVIRLLKKEGELNDYTPMFKHWVKSKGFQLVSHSHSALGLKDVLSIPAKACVSGKLCILAWQC